MTTMKIGVIEMLADIRGINKDWWGIKLLTN